MPRKVIVLGHTGTLGRPLYEHFQRDGASQTFGFSSQTMDLLRPESLAPLGNLVDEATILFVASAITPEKGQTVDTLMANISMVANVARFLEAHTVGKVVYVSSDAVYGFDYNPVTEDTPVSLESYYAIAKYTGERILRCVAEAKGLPLLILRLPGIFGPGDRHSAYGPNRFARTLASEKTIRLFGNGEEQRDHLYVGDAVRLLAALAPSDAAGVVNVASGQSRSFMDVVEAIRRLVPHEFEVVTVPRKSPVTHRSYDTTRLSRAVPEFRYTPFEEALRQTLTAFGAAA